MISTGQTDKRFHLSRLIDCLFIPDSINAACPQGWTNMGGSCYIFNDEKLTWHDAMVCTFASYIVFTYSGGILYPLIGTTLSSFHFGIFCFVFMCV